MRVYFLHVLRQIVSRFDSNSVETKSAALERIFRQIDRDIAGFRRKTGLSCPSGCGRCCETADVETTPLEMLPMAGELVRRGEADAWYARAGMENRCVFYVPGHEKGYGRCASYRWRPLICRLFGFAANRDKHGQLRLVACKTAKEQATDLVEKVQDDVVEKRISPPVMTDYSFKAAAVDPVLGQDMMPINQALQKALERVWLNRRFSSVGK